MNRVADTLAALGAHNPEWAPWLSVVGKVLEAADDLQWEDSVPAAPDAAIRNRDAPALAQTPIAVGARVERLWPQLVDWAVTSGASALAGLATAGHSAAFSRTVFFAALHRDDAVLRRLALASGTDPEVLNAVAHLLPVPFLHACARRFEEHARAWRRGYCPVCAAWPALAEVCGVERTRWLRCARCGAAWPGAPLRCPFCETREHGLLGTLVAEGASAASVDVCNRCHGYLKVRMTLKRSPPAMVMLDDLAGVELDIAAATRGYARPAGLGCSLHPETGGCHAGSDA